MASHRACIVCKQKPDSNKRPLGLTCPHPGKPVRTHKTKLDIRRSIPLSESEYHLDCAGSICPTGLRAIRDNYRVAKKEHRTIEFETRAQSGDKLRRVYPDGHVEFRAKGKWHELGQIKMGTKS
jgi:hypothetical protein